MNQEQALSLLKETKLVAILRGIPVKQATDIATALYDGGVRVLEFTFDHDDPDCVAHNCQRIRAVKKIFGDEMVFFASLCNIPFNLALYSIGAAQLSGTDGARLDWRKVLNMPVIATLLSVVLLLIIALISLVQLVVLRKREDIF